MKNVNVFRLLSLPVSFILGFFIVGFVAWDFNVSTMNENQRVGILLFTLFSIVISNGLISIFNGDLK